MSHPIVKSIPCSGCLSYLIGCRTTGRALLVDPKVGQEATYAGLLAAYGLELHAVLDTHTHADHLSAGPRFVGDGVELWMSANSECARPRRDLGAGEPVQVGELAFEVLPVPGHTPDSIALFGHGLVLTGDSLFIGGLARSDFRGSDPAQLFDSVQGQLMGLAGGTLVFPGHDYGDRLFSTIAHERATNPALQHASGADYARSLDQHEGGGNTPAVDAALRTNLAASPELPESAPNAAACCAAPSGGTARSEVLDVTAEECLDELEELTRRSLWIDVREPWEFEQGHIPGTRSVPLSELGFTLGDLAREEPLTISCRSGVRSMSAARTLERLGVARAPRNLTGGILAWQERDYPIEGQPVD